jgi:translation initiation factor IF-2
MKKIRIYELAKELKVEPRKVIEDARRLGFDVGVASNSLSDEQANQIRSKYYVKKSEPAQMQVKLIKKPKVEAPTAEESGAATAPALAEEPAPPIEEEPTKLKKTKETEITPEIKVVKMTQLKPVELPPPPRPPIIPTHVAVAETAPPPMAQAVQPAPHPPVEAHPPVEVEPVSDKARLAPKTQVIVLKPSGAVQPQVATTPTDLTQAVYVPPRDDRRRRYRRPMRTPTTKTDHAAEPSTAVVAPRAPVVKELRPVKLMEGVTVREFSEKLQVAPRDVVRQLMQRGVLATINQTLDPDIAREIGKGLGYDVYFSSFEDLVEEREIERLIESGEEEHMGPRAPVVTVMGHVDHGKTSLLDAIRQTRVAEKEAGGITQHIGAYAVAVPDPDDRSRTREIVFLDTPGHEAFTLMRARGAQVTDIVVLVVAADDGVMPQTVEAIEHAKAAHVPIVVAINKIDKPEANPDRVKQSLAELGLLWDGWGGDTVMVEVSAKRRMNLDSLLEMIILTADILDLKANTTRKAIGTVLEAKLDKGRGPVATILVQQGVLRVGDPFVVGATYGRVRAMFNDRGRHAAEAGPSTPVEVIGLEMVPQASDKVIVVEDTSTSQKIAAIRQLEQRQARARASAATTLEQLYLRMQAGEVKELQVILKTDVQGSLEALRQTLEKLSSDKVKVQVIRSGVGAITESDVLLAAASSDMQRTAIIVGFNVRPEPRAREVAEHEGVDIRLHSIIYKVEEEIRSAMLGMLAPEEKEITIGRAQVRQVFRIAKFGNVAGCMVIDGSIKRNAHARVIRDHVVVYQGGISSLKRFKDDAGEVKEGFECGISVENFNDIKEGDVIEAFIIEKVAQTL